MRDFVPDEDFLTVDISSFTALGSYQLTDVTLSEGAPFLPYEEVDGWYELKLSLLADGQTEPFEAIVPFRSVGGEVTLDDITLITGLST